MNCPYGKGLSHRGDYNLFRLAIVDPVTNHFFLSPIPYSLFPAILNELNE